MFQKLLIANRGEIAVRIIRACREMGIKTVAVYSQADADALHTQLADESICIGKAEAKDSYLNMERILSATIASGADAIHPGFGFLSENSKFAALCEKCNIAFIGPSARTIEETGNKSEARNAMVRAGVPVIPGTKEPIFTAEAGRKFADEIGYPVMIKAALGGGGKGMRVVQNSTDFEKNFQNAQREAENGFGDNSMYIEKYIEHPKHIEFQILADNEGNTIHLGERDCSVQRRHQKMIEESPCIALDEDLREQMGAMAVRAAKAVGYRNAGTVEFLLDSHRQFYFMEINTRIQVEHGVTELVTGIDLVKEQTDLLHKRMMYVEKSLNRSYQKCGVVKYDAFKELGGQLSFAYALLNDSNTGFVMNCIHSREGSYTYIKDIVRGECELPLSEEEAEAVKNAIASNSPQPTTTTIAGGKKIRKINKSKAQSEETPSKKEAVAKKKSASQSTTKENE